MKRTTSTFKPGDKVYWFTELVTVIRKTKRGIYLCHREARDVVMATSRETVHYPAQDQEIAVHALSLQPNNALNKIVRDYLTKRGSDPSRSIH